jgi:hypothetical protein
MSDSVRARLTRTRLGLIAPINALFFGFARRSSREAFRAQTTRASRCRRVGTGSLIRRDTTSDTVIGPSLTNTQRIALAVNLILTVAWQYGVNAL